MFKKLPVLGLAALAAIALSLPAHATAARVKGKFKPEESGSPVLGSARVKPMGGGVERVGLRLQHVWRADYKVYVATDQQGPTLVPDCDLSAPSNKGHDGCVGYVTLAGTPNMVYLAVPENATSAWAVVK